MRSKTTTKTPGLSRREIEVLATWERARRQAITMDDLRQVVGDAVAKKVAHSLVRKRALLRLSRGRFLLRPFRSLAHKSTPSSAVLVSAFLQSEPHYLGGLWALTLHGLTSQQHTSRLDAFVTRRHKTAPKTLAEIKFHVVPAAAMQYGSQTIEFEQTTVEVSDPEKTLVDLLEHPAAAGSVSKAVEIVEGALDRIDIDKLIAYATRGARPATCQRLGVLVERLKPQPSKRRFAALHAMARSRKSLLSMHPGARRQGVLNARWNVIENDG